MKLSGRNGFCVRKILLVHRAQDISITVRFPFLCLNPQIFMCLLFAFIHYLFAILQTTKFFSRQNTQKVGIQFGV